jgi:hypothetical protein
MEWVIGIIVVLYLIGMSENNKEQKATEKEQEEIKSKQQAAEDYIMKSGDEEAIKKLMLMRADSSSYQQQFKQAAGGNDVMKTAFGVFTGMIAANLVMDAIYAHQLQEAITAFNVELEGMGGLDNFDMASMGDYDVPEVDSDSFDLDDLF